MTGTAAFYRDLLPGAPLIESPFFEHFAQDAFPEAALCEIATSLNREGYAIIDFPDPDFARTSDAIKATLAPRFDLAAWRAQGMRNSEGLRIQDAWTFDENVKRIACNAEVLALLSRLYGRRAWPFQTLNFPVGTQQHPHSDSVHFSTLPERFMCGVWVALEDISESSGPLIYYPGSHKWPIVYNEMIGVRVIGTDTYPTSLVYYRYWDELLATHGKPTTFHPKKGQALIWAANLLHGGAPQTDSSVTRWSQVTHYYCDGCLYLTPMLSDIPVGNIYLREMTDISTGRKISNTYGGASIARLNPAIRARRNTTRPRAMSGYLAHRLRSSKRRIFGWLGKTATNTEGR